MKIFLMTNEGWKFFEDLSGEERAKRKIIISSSAEIGNSADVGDYAKIGDTAEIGSYAKIGDSAKIGKSAKIRDYAEIGDYQVVTHTAKDFSVEVLYQQLNIISDNGYYILYKSVKPDLSSFYTDAFVYKEGMEWRDDSLSRNQSIECGAGCHFSTYKKAVKFAQKRPHMIISAKVHIDDILSVHQKVRVRAFSGVKIIKLDM